MVVIITRFQQLALECEALTQLLHELLQPELLLFALQRHLQWAVRGGAPPPPAASARYPRAKISVSFGPEEPFTQLVHSYWVSEKMMSIVYKQWWLEPHPSASLGGFHPSSVTAYETCRPMTLFLHTPVRGCGFSSVNGEQPEDRSHHVTYDGEHWSSGCNMCKEQLWFEDLSGPAGGCWQAHMLNCSQVRERTLLTHRSASF